MVSMAPILSISLISYLHVLVLSGELSDSSNDLLVNFLDFKEITETFIN